MNCDNDLYIFICEFLRKNDLSIMQTLGPTNIVSFIRQQSYFYKIDILNLRGFKPLNESKT